MRKNGTVAMVICDLRKNAPQKSSIAPSKVGISAKLPKTNKKSFISEGFLAPYAGFDTIQGN